MIKIDCLPIGTIVKTHGIHGELVIEVSNSKLIENIKESVFLEIEGLLVPFFIQQILAQSPTRIRVMFLWTKTETQAKKLVGYNVFVKKDDINFSDEELFETPEILKGFTVIDKNYGELGFFTDFIDSQENPLMLIIKNKKELLIPFHQEFIEKINKKNKLIHIKTPEGLIDLYLE